MNEDDLPEAENERLWGEWLATRPPHVRAVGERFKPWRDYRIKTTGQKVRPLSFGEGKSEKDEVTLTVVVIAGTHNVGFCVFGLSAEDLEPWS